MLQSVSKAVVVFFLMPLCLSADEVGRMSFPPPATGADHGWEMCVPEHELVNSEKLQRAMQYMEDALDDPRTPDTEEDGIQFACVLRNGRMIWPNGSTPQRQDSDLDTPCQIYSATKTFGTGVLGLLIDQGLADLDMPANPIIDIDLSQEDGQGAKEYPSYDTITLRHLATFTDGYQDVRPRWPEPGMYYPFNPESPRFAPGSKYAYNSSPLDYDAYLDLLQRNNHNFTRLWTWESAAWVRPDSSKVWLDPLPFARTGPGVAADGRPRFDLTKMNPAYFDRLRDRVAAANERNIYVGVMLFQGFSVSRKGKSRRETPWAYHPFHQSNNVNGIDGDANGDGYEIHELVNDLVTAIQETCVRKVVDTLNEFDNVVFEIGKGLRARAARCRRCKSRRRRHGSH